MLLKEKGEDVWYVIFGFFNFYVLIWSLYIYRRINIKNKFYLIKN